MAQTYEISNRTGDPIKVGTTGTISSLMSRELESTKHSPPASSSSRKKLQTTSVSVPCGYTPRRTQPRRNSPNEPSSSGSSGIVDNSGIKSPGSSTQNPKPKPRRNGHRAPMLSSSDDATVERAKTKEKLVNKKGHTYIVEVVDLKCNNPVSSRLKKLSFSKLSESNA